MKDNFKLKITKDATGKPSGVSEVVELTATDAALAPFTQLMEPDTVHTGTMGRAISFGVQTALTMTLASKWYANTWNPLHPLTN